MEDVVSLAEYVERMNTLRFSCVREFPAAVGLDLLGRIAKVCNGSLDEIDGGIARFFLVSIDKSLS